MPAGSGQETYGGIVMLNHCGGRHMENFYIIVNEEKDGHKAVRQVIEEYLESR